MSRVRAHLPWIAGLLIGVAGVAWLLRPTALAVETAAVAVAPLRDLLVEEGRTRVHRHLEVAAPVTGRLREPRLEPGDRVAVGDTVAVLTPAPLDERARAEAQAVLAQAAMRAREAAAQREQARLALAEATRERVRTTQLEEAGALPARDLEQARQLEAMRTRDEVVAVARVAAAEAALRGARAALLGADPARATAPVVVRAPIAGTVLRVLAPHERVVGAGTPLLEIGDPTSLEVVVEVLSRDAPRIRPGMPMELRTAPSAPPHPGRVERVEPAAFTRRSALGVDEQRVVVVGRFTGRVPALGDGYELDAAIVLADAPSVRQVPTAALVPRDDSGWAVYVVDGGRVRLVPVTTGRRGTDAVELLARHGITTGTRVVLRPDDRLRDGVRVRAAP